MRRSTCRSRCRRRWRASRSPTLYAPNGPFGAILDDWFGVKVGFTPLGVVMALIFVGLPFVVRTVQPVLEEIDARDRGSLRDAGRRAAGAP